MAKKDEQKVDDVQEEQLAEQVTKEAENLQRTKEQVLVSAAEYWDFSEYDVFVGTYVQDVIGESGDKEGELIGYEFEHAVRGDLFIITSAHAITKAINMVVDTFDKEGKKIGTAIVKEIPGAILQIEFKEKIETQGGRTFNKFRISLL